MLVDESKIVGISQYYYTEKFEYDNIEEIESSIRKFIDETITPNVPKESFVADVVFEKRDIRLLELNPFGLSDPCLFYSYDKLDGSFLYNK